MTSSFEASLGYFLGPVLTYVLSIFLLKERIVALPAIASATAFFGVFYFIIFSEAGIPFFGILLGLCYSLYTVYKRGFHVIGAKISVFSEFTVMLPFAVAYLLFKFHHDTLTGFISTTATENALLVFIGLINVIPMLLYSFASRETPGVTMSFLQFVSPVCNFFLAVFYMARISHGTTSLCFHLFGSEFYFTHRLRCSNRARRIDRPMATRCRTRQ